jgi:hypothetical protein
LRRFLRRLLAFALFPAAVLLAMEAALLGSGELWPIPRVLAFQRAHPGSLYLRGIDQTFYAYKYQAILQRHPAIVVAGSSRTMKFRAGMFGERSSAFFNAGGMLASVRDLHDFAEMVPAAAMPAVLVLGIDPWWLNPNVKPAFDFRAETAPRAAWSFDEHVVGGRWLLKNLPAFGRELLSLARGAQPLAVGIGARQRGGGFRPDGSFKSPLPVPATDREWTFVDREVPPVIERARRAIDNFTPADGLDADRLKLLAAAVARLQQHDVLVIGYLPPFSSEVIAQLTGDPRHRQMFAEFRSRVPLVFIDRGLPVLDASEVASLGMDDRCLSDGMHAEETLQLHALEVMLRDPRVAAALPGAARAVRTALDSPRTDFWHADLPE